jgi:hypothetical protein
VRQPPRLHDGGNSDAVAAWDGNAPLIE